MHIRSGQFVDLAYRIFKTATPEEKDMLSVSERRMFNSDAVLYGFCAAKRIDYILFLMAKMGVEWNLQVYKDANKMKMVELLARDSHTIPQKEVDLIQSMADNFIGSISSRDIMFNSHTLTQKGNSKIYSLSEFSRSLYERMAHMDISNTWETHSKKSKESVASFNEIILAQLNSFDYVESVLGISIDDVRVMAALFKHKDSALTMIEISDATNSFGRKKFFRGNMEKLLDAELVITDLKDAKKWRPSTRFMISTKGVGKYMEYLKFIYDNGLSKK